MKTITVCRASGTAGVEVMPVTLRIENDVEKAHVPSYVSHAVWLETGVKFYENEARLVGEALAALPRGTRTALLTLLLRQQADVYRGGSHGDPPLQTRVRALREAAQVCREYECDGQNEIANDLEARIVALIDVPNRSEDESKSEP